MNERRLQRLAAQSRLELQSAAQRLEACQQQQKDAQASLRTIEQDLAENQRALGAPPVTKTSPSAWMLELEARQRARLRQDQDSLVDGRTRAEQALVQSAAKAETAKRVLEAAWGKHRSVQERTGDGLTRKRQE